MFSNKADQVPTPSGLLTTMFTDIVSSTQLKGMVPGETSARRDAAYRTDIKTPHDAVVLTCVQEFDGYVINSTGDGYCVTFVDAEEAVLCALQIQERLRLHPIPTPLGPLQIRIGLHTGMAGATGGDYTAATMDKTARVQGQAQGGQVVVSRETHALVAGKLQGITFEQAGTFDLKGLAADGLYRVALIAALSPVQDGDAISNLPPRQKPVEQQPGRRSLLWLAPTIVLLLLGITGYFLRARLTPPPAPLLPVGSVWTGSFHFLPPIQNYAGAAGLTITQRTGDQFVGLYATEGDKYKWRVAGTAQNGRLRWEFTQALKNQASDEAVGNAYVEGIVEGDQLTGVFHERSSPGEKAALVMRRGN